MPIIFLGGLRIGGYEDLRQLLARGELTR